MKHEERSDTIC